MRAKIAIYIAIILSGFVFIKSAFAYNYNFDRPVLNPKLSGYKMASLKEFKGKIVIVNLWATWCPPCRHEIPELINFYNSHKRAVALIGINVNVTPAGVKRFLDEYDIDYPVIYATPEIMGEYSVTSEIPQSFFFNRQGKLVFHWTGELPRMVLDTMVSKLGGE